MEEREEGAHGEGRRVSGERWVDQTPQQPGYIPWRRSTRMRVTNGETTKARVTSRQLFATEKRDRQALQNCPRSALTRTDMFAVGRVSRYRWAG